MFQLDVAPKGNLEVDCLTNGPVQTNTYFAFSEGEAVAIDPAWQGELLWETFSASHPDIKLKAVICTHGHADHLGGVAGLRRALGQDLPLYISESDAALIPKSIESQKTNWNIDTEDPGPVTGFLHEGDTFQVGSATLQMFSVPGHTQGGLVLFAATEDGNFAFVGDTLFPGGHGRVDLPESDPADMRRSLAKIAQTLPATTLCLVGHDQPTVLGVELETNAFIQHALKRAANPLQ